MGQYWKVVNLDKREFVEPHKLGCGLKLWEQLANHPGTGTALIILCAAMKEQRGGGDLDLEARAFTEEGRKQYQAIASRTIGRWAGDRIALVGDYAEDSDLPPEFKASEIYGLCEDEGHIENNDTPEGAMYKTEDGQYAHYVVDSPPVYKDISDDVCVVIEHELGGKYTGNGWRHFKYNTNEYGERIG